MNLPFLCPENFEELKKHGNEWRSSSGRIYPQREELPWLVRNPSHLMMEWNVLLQQTLADLKSQATAAHAQGQISPLATSKKRLQKLATAYADQAKLVETLMGSLNQAPIAGPVTQALQKILPTKQTLFGYSANLFRDWTWGEEENRQTLELVQKLLPATKPDACFVFLGCGSGRFLYDVHTAYQPALSIGLDINPLLLGVAQKMFQGRELSLYEFPSQPKKSDQAALLRTLKAPAKLKGQWQLALADIAALPLADNSADVIFTPWLLDILPHETAAVIARIRQVLKPGGTWIQLGPLGFQRRNKAENLCAEELRELVELQGFKISGFEQRGLPYIQSPAESQHRTEWVTAFSAEKTAASIPEQQRHLNYLPHWLLDPTMPIPKLQSIEASLFVHRLYAEVLGLVDGNNSLEAIATILNKNFAIESDQALGVTLRFFRTAWEAELWN